MAFLFREFLKKCKVIPGKVTGILEGKYLKILCKIWVLDFWNAMFTKPRFAQTVGNSREILPTYFREVGEGILIYQDK